MIMTGPRMTDTVHGEAEEGKNSLKDKLKTLLWVRRELSLSIVALLIGVVSYEFNDLWSIDPTGLFSRSGALIVLLAVVNEYGLGKLRERQLDYEEPDIVRNFPSEVRKLFKPSVFFGQTIAGGITHIQAILGTVIWGYGDLFIRLLSNS
jgi:hypothetical protein